MDFPIHPLINYWGQVAETDSPQLRNKHSSFIPDPHAKVTFNVIKKIKFFFIYNYMYLVGENRYITSTIKQHKLSM